MQLTDAIQHFLSELQRRKVLRVLSGYVIGAWIVLQVAVALQTAWALSATFSGTVLNLMIIGFPVALGLAWFFDITPQGIRRTTGPGDGTTQRLQSTDVILLGLLAFVFAIASVEAIISHDAAPPSTQQAIKPEPPRLGDKSIAVLPFTNLSKNDDDAVFADGLTEEVLDVLAHVKGLRVISRTSSFAFKGKDTPLPEIAKVLGVRHVLEGSIRHDGATVRITAQLIDVTTDTHLWSQTFERSADDVFAAQDDIARAVGRALNLEINASAKTRSAPTRNLDAYRLYLKGRESYIELSKSGVLKSIDLFKQAIALDQNFAEAYAQLGWAYGARRDVDPSSWPRFRPQVAIAADAALKLNPKLATAIATKSALSRVGGNWNSSIDLAKQAVAIEPSNSSALVALGVSELVVGNVEQAQKAYEEIDRVDPLFGGGPLSMLLLAFARGDDEGVSSYGAKLRSSKGLHGFVALSFLGDLAQEQGDHAKAEQIFQTLAAASSRASLIEPVVAALRSPSARGKAVDALKAEESRDPTFDPIPVYVLIGAYNTMFDAASARFRTQRDDPGAARMMFFVWHVVARGQGSNPKLKQLLRDMGLVDYWKAHGWPDRCRAKGEDDFECS